MAEKMGRTAESTGKLYERASSPGSLFVQDVYAVGVLQSILIVAGQIAENVLGGGENTREALQKVKEEVKKGAEKARQVACETLGKVKKAVGLGG